MAGARTLAGAGESLAHAGERLPWPVRRRHRTCRRQPEEGLPPALVPPVACRRSRYRHRRGRRHRSRRCRHDVGIDADRASAGVDAPSPPPTGHRLRCPVAEGRAREQRRLPPAPLPPPTETPASTPPPSSRRRRPVADARRAAEPPPADTGPGGFGAVRPDARPNRLRRRRRRPAPVGADAVHDDAAADACTDADADLCKGRESASAAASAAAGESLVRCRIFFQGHVVLLSLGCLQPCVANGACGTKREACLFVAAAMRTG